MNLSPATTAIIKRLLVGRNNRPLRGMLSRLEPADIASIFQDLNQREQTLLLEALASIHKDSETLKEIPEPQLVKILQRFSFENFISLIAHSSEENSAYFLALISEEQRENLLNDLEPPKRHRIEQFLSYPEDSVGRIMDRRVFSLPIDISVSEGMELLRSKAQSESIYYIYCTDEEGVLQGVASLRQLATAPSKKVIRDIVKTDIVTLNPSQTNEEAAQVVSHYDFIAVPVIDREHHLLGIVTVDDVLDIIQEQATADIYAQAGLVENDRVFTTPIQSIKNRLPWMFLNLALAALASLVVSSFEETLSQLILLASLINIVAGMGGNTAIQTLTVVTRGLATGDFSFISYRKAIFKEVYVGLSIGILTGIFAGLLIYFWKQNAMVAVVICISMILNSFVASIVGALVPILLRRFNRDPAVGSGVLVTTVTDLFGFFAFLGIASLALKYL